MNFFGGIDSIRLRARFIIFLAKLAGITEADFFRGFDEFVAWVTVPLAGGERCEERTLPFGFAGANDTFAEVWWAGRRVLECLKLLGIEGK